MMKKYLTCAETAKLVRKALKAEFPKIKFSVRSKTYSGGASIRVSWTDGPAEPTIKAIVNRYQGADFDGMIDLKTYRNSELDGRPVSFGADYIFTDRNYSVDWLTEIVNTVAERWGFEAPKVVMSCGTANLEQDFQMDNGQYFSTLVHRERYNLTA